MTEGRLRFETAIFVRFFTSQGPGPMLTEVYHKPNSEFIQILKCRGFVCKIYIQVRLKSGLVCKYTINILFVCIFLHTK